MERESSEPTIGELLAPMFQPEALQAHRIEMQRELAGPIGPDSDDEEEGVSLIPLSRFRLLPENPKAADAVAFVNSCCEEIGVGFHPDTDFAEYVNVEADRALFNRTDSFALNWQIVRAAELLAGEKEDVYGICVNHAQRWYAEIQEDVEPTSVVSPAETA